jgi:MFS family permease
MSSRPPLSPPPRTTWPPSVSFALVIGAQVLLFAGSNLPTPLFPTYESRYGFGSGVVTLLFAVYVAALLPVLLRLGAVADRVGRRPLLVIGVAITAASSITFAVAGNPAWLFAGEIIYGIGAGMVMSCVAVVIRELHPRRDLAAGALAASTAAAAGLTLGPLVSGLLASITPWPTVTPYVLHAVLAVLLATALVAIPETRPTSTAERTTPPSRVPATIRWPFAAAAAAGAASFMMVGWVFGLSPSYLHEELHVELGHPVVAGSFAALVMLTNGATQLLARRHHSPAVMRRALVGVAIGMALMAASTVANSPIVLIAGALVAGSSSGVTQMNALATIQRVVPVHARSTVTSTYFVICYVALSLPVIIAGTAADHLGLGIVTAGYTLGLVVFVTVALALSHRATAVTVAQPDTPASTDVAHPTPTLVSTGPGR